MDVYVGTQASLKCLSACTLVPGLHVIADVLIYRVISALIRSDAP